MLQAEQRLKDCALESFSDRQLVDGSKQNGVCNDDLKDSALEFFSERKLANCFKQNGVSRTTPWSSSRIGSWSTAIFLFVLLAPMSLVMLSACNMLVQHAGVTHCLRCDTLVQYASHKHSRTRAASRASSASLPPACSAESVELFSVRCTGGSTRSAGPGTSSSNTPFAGGWRPYTALPRSASPLTDAPRAVSYSDGEGADAGVDVALRLPGYPVPMAAFMETPRELRMLWARQLQQSAALGHDIFEIEAIGPLIVLSMWGHLMHGMLWTHYTEIRAYLFG